MPNGRDLIEMVAQGYETPDVPDKANNKDSSKPKKHSANSDDDDDDDDDEDPEYSFGEFRVLVLRKGGTIVTVATLRWACLPLLCSLLCRGRFLGPAMYIGATTT
jgi:hypothetical protein